MIIFVMLVLFSLQSRAAIVTFIIITFFVLNQAKNQFRNVPFKYSILLLSTVALWTLFHLKQNSLNGRAFILKLTLENSFERPILGVGYGEFSSFYKEIQANYFKAEGQSLRGYSASDLPDNCFNEVLQIFTEAGILGMTCFLVLIIYLFKAKLSIGGAQQNALKLILLSAFVFSNFSYPFHSLPILAVITIALALIANYSTTENSVNLPKILVKTSLIFLTSLSIISLLYFRNKHSAMQRWYVARSNALKPLEIVSEYQVAYPFLKENGSFLYEYGVVLYTLKCYEESIKFLTASNKLLPNIDPALKLGQCYQAIGNIPKAEECYFYGMYCLPRRVKPKFFLLNLYITQKDTLNAINICKNILNSPIKTYSLESIKIENFAARTLGRLEK